MIVELDDIIERLANQCGVYGACKGDDGKCDGTCRPCWTATLKSEILTAVEVERRLKEQSR